MTFRVAPRRAVLLTPIAAACMLAPLARLAAAPLDSPRPASDEPVRRFDVGGGSQMWQGTVVAYGSLANDTALEVDGMSVMSLLNQGSIAGVYHNQGAYQEMSYQVVAGSADSQTGGVRINMIPKEGGNRFSFDGSLETD